MYMSVVCFHKKKDAGEIKNAGFQKNFAKKKKKELVSPNLIAPKESVNE